MSLRNILEYALMGGLSLVVVGIVPVVVAIHNELVLRMAVRLYPKDDPRREEFLAEFVKPRRVDSAQLVVALWEASRARTLHARDRRRRPRRPRTERPSIRLLAHLLPARKRHTLLGDLLRDENEGIRRPQWQACRAIVIIAIQTRYRDGLSALGFPPLEYWFIDAASRALDTRLALAAILVTFGQLLVTYMIAWVGWAVTFFAILWIIRTLAYERKVAFDQWARTQNGTPHEPTDESH